MSGTPVYLQILVALGLVLEITLVLLALYKSKIRISYFFFVYLIVLFVSDLIISPIITIESRDRARQIYVLKEFCLDFLKIGVVVELNRKIFKYYPRVQRSNLFGLIGAIIFFFIYHSLTPQKEVIWWYSFFFDMHSKILQTTSIILLLMAGSILFYRLHIATAYKFLIIGFLTSQLPVALGFAIMAIEGEKSKIPVSYFSSTFFFIALIVWTRVYLSNDQDPSKAFYHKLTTEK